MSDPLGASENSEGKSNSQEHNQKYDRQIRLWGKHGQASIEKTRIACLGSGPAASETLKNLVLPNMGRFTIFDDAIATKADLGNNFFITKDQAMGDKARAHVVKDLLLEMNPDVQGEAVAEDPHHIIDNDIEQFQDYTLVIASQIREKQARKLAAFCYEKRIPFLWLRINGLFGCVRLAFAEHTVVETHPEDDRQDLYIYPKQLERFPALAAYLDSFDLDSEDAKYYSHIPMVAILAKLVKRWQEQHDGKLPARFQGKEFAQFMKEQQRFGKNNPNFEEAEAVKHKAYAPPRIPDDVSEVLGDPAVTKIDIKTPRFWILVAALKQFIKEEGAGFLPVSTNIPDMTCESNVYVKLKQIYQTQADVDVTIVKGHVDKILVSVGLPEYTVPRAEVEYFVKNCRNLACIRTRSIEQEHESLDTEELLEEFDLAAFKTAEEKMVNNPENTHWYFCIRGAEEFREKRGRLPGVYSKAHVDELLSLAKKAVALNVAVARAAAMVAASFSKEAKEKQQKEHEEKLRELQLVLGDMYKVTSAFGEPRSVKLANEENKGGNDDYSVERRIIAEVNKINEDLDLMEEEEEERERLRRQAVDEILISEEANALKSIVMNTPFYQSKAMSSHPMPDECLYEICRMGGAELHTTGAVIGGVASQICLKLATQQYKPLNNTFLYNGIFAKASRWIV